MFLNPNIELYHRYLSMHTQNIHTSTSYYIKNIQYE